MDVTFEPLMKIIYIYIYIYIYIHPLQKHYKTCSERLFVRYLSYQQLVPRCQRWDLKKGRPGWETPFRKRRVLKMDVPDGRFKAQVPNSSIQFIYRYSRSGGLFEAQVLNPCLRGTVSFAPGFPRGGGIKKENLSPALGLDSSSTWNLERHCAQDRKSKNFYLLRSVGWWGVEWAAGWGG